MIDTVLAVTFAIGFPLLSYPVYVRRRAALMAGNWEVKRREYGETIIWLASMGIAPLGVWVGMGRDFNQLGLRYEVSWQSTVALGAALLVSVVLFLQVSRTRRDAPSRDAVTRALAPVAEYLPQSAREAKWFRGVSLAAGTGEEVFYRGFLLWYLSAGTTMVWAVVFSSLLFGVAHVMHGVQATIRATMMGFLLAGLYVFSGSLWPSMLLHTAVDLSSGELGLAVLGESPAAAV